LQCDKLANIGAPAHPPVGGFAYGEFSNCTLTNSHMNYSPLALMLRYNKYENAL
jgi:hypothetical protein